MQFDGISGCGSESSVDGIWWDIRLRERPGQSPQHHHEQELLPQTNAKRRAHRGLMPTQPGVTDRAPRMASDGGASLGSTGDRLVSVAYFVVSSITASWPRFTVVSTLTDVSLLMIVVSRVCLDVITVSLACPTRSVFPRPHPARLTTTRALASTNRISLLRVTASA
jgi:hypothetical protein